MAKTEKNNLPSLEVALVGVILMGSAICVRLWSVLADIREALTDPQTMAVIITENSIVADNKKAEGMLNGARNAYADTEKVVALFSVALAIIGVALMVRLIRRGQGKA